MLSSMVWPGELGAIVCPAHAQLSDPIHTGKHMQFAKNLKVSDPHEPQSEGQIDTPLKPFADFRFSDPFGCYNIKGHHTGSES